ncbi:MAG TPA: amidohydrolase family protein [Acidimicrobiia bacterium]|nr:amidohydrolase family protein [Acidimicrobiia bacterium]
MTLRVELRSPWGETVVRDVVDRRWAEPSGTATTTIGAGMWALPGLADAHAHLAAAELNYQPGVLDDAIDRARHALAAGVTLVLDKGWTDDVTIRLIDVLDELERPEIEAAAEIVAAKGGYYPDFAIEVSPDDLPSTVTTQARAGAGWVKLIGDWPRSEVGPVANFDESDLRIAVDRAEAAGARVAIHTMAREVPSAAVRAGVHSIEHGMFLEEEDLDALAGRGGMWVPTVLRCEATRAQLGEASRGGKLFTQGLERLRRLLPLALEAGVRVLAGTDLVGTPADVAAEAIRLRDYGLSAAQVVEAVSTSVFIATGRSAVFEEGTPANAVLFAVNPIESPDVLAHPSLVIRLGGLV